MEHNNHQHLVDLENVREQLAEQHLSQFLLSLKNDEDPVAERHSLIAVMSASLGRLLEVEQGFVKSIFEDSKDGICPSCLSTCLIDYERLRSVAVNFNHYLESESENDENHN